MGVSREQASVRTALAVSSGAAAGLGLGLALGWALAGGSGGTPDARPASGAVPRLEQALARAEADNAALRDRIEVLEARWAGDDEGDSAASPTASGSTPGAPAAEPSPTPAVTADPAEAEAEFEAAGHSAFDETRLLAAGFHPADVERLRRAWEEIELEKLYLMDERARSSVRDGRFWARLLEIERQAVADLGEEDYDALLYASGAQNRVRVRGVLPESAADSAGLEPGDQITAYDGEPIFRMHALKQATLGCEVGRTVSLSVLQDGQVNRVWVPCGPLGIEYEMINAEPR